MNSNRLYAKMRTELKREKERYGELEQKYNALVAVINDSDELWEIVKDMPSIRSKFIVEYLKSLKRSEVRLVGGEGGFSALTPPMRPKNLEDASRLAQKIINY